MPQGRKEKEKEMLLSEMLGVERDTDFGVKGYSVTFKIVTLLGKYEYLMYRWSAVLDWREAEGTMLYNIIAGAPGNIIHLPPPLTDEQREQLKALWTLGYRWIAKDHDDKAFAYGTIRPLKAGPIWLSDGHGYLRISKELPVFVVASLVNLSDPEPYDIGKALGVGG